MPADVDVVLPCLDEVEALPTVLACLPVGARAIVVDNGSDDGSADLARSLGATVVAEPRRGYGAACHRGLLSATAAVVAFCDADASLSLADLPLVAGPVLAGEADLMLGWRRAVGGAWPLHARVANAALALPVSALAGHRLHDLGPLRAARRADLLRLGVEDRRSGYPLETVLRAARAGWRVREVDVTYTPRIGRSKVTGTVRGTIQAMADMTRVLAEGRGR